MFTRPLTVGLALSSLIGVSYGQQYVIDFDRDDDDNLLSAGAVNVEATQPYADVFDTGVGLILSTDAPATKPLNLYDTEGVGGQDDDLERNSQGTGEWEGGSLTTEALDNGLIINTDTNISVPNDAGSGGDMILTFGRPLVAFGFDFVDLDSSANATLVFRDTGSATTASIPFANFEDGSGDPLFERTNVQFGNRNGNRILGIQAADLGMTQFDEVTFSMTSSGTIGTLYFETVPEPGTTGMALTGLLACAVRRTRRHS